MTFIPKIYLYYNVPGPEGWGLVGRYIVKAWQIAKKVWIVKGEKTIPKLFYVNDKTVNAEIKNACKVPDGKDIVQISYYKYFWQAAFKPTTSINLRGE